MEKLRSYAKIVIGNMLLAASVVYFVLPYNILSGGCAGTAVILHELFDLPETKVINIMVITLFVIGYLFLGKDFAIKTGLSSAAYPFFIYAFSYIHIDIKADPLLMSIFGAVIAGLGIGLVIKEGASTGGTDIPPLIVNKITGISIPLLMGLFDGALVILGILAYSWQEVMIGLIYIYVSNMVINNVIVPKSGAVALFIISEKHEEIRNYIHDKLSRGTTIINGKGGYTGDEKQVIMAVVSMPQYNLLSQEVASIDPYAFMIVSDAKDVRGEGFTYEYRV